MNLREGEVILKKYRHHYTPFFWMIFKILIGFVPFYVFLLFFQSAMSLQWIIIWNLIFVVVFALIILYWALIYWLDLLIVTNQRIIYIDYKFLTVSEESQTFIRDVQDIVSEEKGILSYFRVFDYGSIRFETPASAVPLIFEDAPDPEGIRQFVYHVKNQ